MVAYTPPTHPDRVKKAKAKEVEIKIKTRDFINAAKKGLAEMLGMGSPPQFMEHIGARVQKGREALRRLMCGKWRE